MGLGRGCQPGHWLMNADLVACKVGNEALASCCLCELGDPGASTGISSGICNERAEEGMRAQRETRLEAARTGRAGEIGGEKSSTPPAKSTYQGLQAVNQARAPCHHLSNSLCKTRHRLFVCALKMENGEFIQFSSMIQCNAFHSL